MCLPTRNAGRLPAVRATQTRSNGGLSETEVNELTVRPTGVVPPVVVVMTVTPVGNAPIVLRSATGSM